MAKKSIESTDQDIIEFPKKDKDKDIEGLREFLDKGFGAGTAEGLSRINFWHSTGSLVVDHVILGGRPWGSPIVPYGRQFATEGLPGSGKSTLLLMVASVGQRVHKSIVIIVDTEERTDLHYAALLGLNVEDIIFVRGHTLEEVYNKLYKLLLQIQASNSDRPVMLIWDSLGSASLKDIMEGEDPSDDPMVAASKLMGKKARVNSAGLELLNPLIAKLKVCFAYSNHLYSKLNVRFGSPWESGGGQKAKYFATVRLRLTRVGQITDKDDNGKERIIGHEVEVEAIKNSMSPYLLKKTAAIIGGKGFCDEYTIWLTCSEKGGPITKAGAWSTWTTPTGEEVKFGGWKGFNEKVVGHPQYQELVEYTKNNL